MRLWQLNGQTIPHPQRYTPIPVENSVILTTLNNRAVKQSRGFKTVHRLEFDALTRSEFDVFNTIYLNGEAVLFEATDGELSISSRSVFVSIVSRSFPYKGSAFRENIIIELTEV